MSTSSSSTVVALAAVTLAIVSVGPAAAQTISNAGFEAPDVSAGVGYQYNPSGAAWTFLNGSGISGNNTGFTVGNPPAPQGVQVAFVQGAGAAVFQAISGFQVGQTYTVTFLAAQRSPVVIQQSFQTVDVRVSGTSLGVFQPSSINYQRFTSGRFTAASTTETLRFVGLNPNGGDNTAFLDDVRLSVVPEPATMGLVLPALLPCALLVRRRRRREQFSLAV